MSATAPVSLTAEESAGCGQMAATDRELRTFSRCLHFRENAAMTSMPLIYDVIPYYAKDRKSPVFHPEIQGVSVDVLVTFEGTDRVRRVGPSLMTLSFLLAGMDRHLHDLGLQVEALIACSQRTPEYKHDRTKPPSWCGIIGRDTWALPIAINSWFYFARSMLDQAMDVVSCSVGVSSPSSMHYAYKSGSFRKDLRKKNAEQVADLIDRAWEGWAARLRDYRDLIGHNNALPFPSIRFAEDAATGSFTGVELFFPADPSKHSPGSRGPGQQFVPIGSYFPETRKAAGEFLQSLLVAIRDSRQPRSGPQNSHKQETRAP